MIDHASRPPQVVVPARCDAQYFFQIGLFAPVSSAIKHSTLQVMPDDHSELVPPLPIPNRTVKRFRADDSAATSVKVGYRQAFIKKRPSENWGVFVLEDTVKCHSPTAAHSLSAVILP
jgi:hypothetical protein